MVGNKYRNQVTEIIYKRDHQISGKDPSAYVWTCMGPRDGPLASKFTKKMSQGRSLACMEVSKKYINVYCKLLYGF